MNRFENAGQRANSIGFLRFGLACCVIISHSYGLSHAPNEPMSLFSGGRLSLGTFGVAGFFALSGFLITRSFLSGLSPLRYLWHRFLRIFPGFWVCLLMVAFVIGPIGYLLGHQSLADYFRSSSRSPGSYVRGNFSLVITTYRISDLYAHNPLPYSINDPLWTLQVEFRCYLAVLALGLMRLFPVSRLLFPLVPLGLWFIYVANRTDLCHNALIPRPSYVMPYLFFAVGALFVLVDRRFYARAGVFWAALVVGALSLHFGGARLVLPLAVPFCLLYLAERLPLRRFDRRGDFSYGMYIYAFPVQQAIVSVGADRAGVLPSILLALTLTLPLAMLSWYCVEKRCLKLKHLDVTRTYAVFRQRVSHALR